MVKFSEIIPIDCKGGLGLGLTFGTLFGLWLFARKVIPGQINNVDPGTCRTWVNLVMCFSLVCHQIKLRPLKKKKKRISPRNI